MLFLQLFGGVALLDENTPVVGPAVQRRRLALLALLAASPTRGLSRDKLIGFFWPDEDRERARHFLADSLFTLRKQLGKESVLTVGDDLLLNPELVRADVADFHEALAKGDREGAVALYRGPFLDGFFVSDAPEFERWVESERARLARLCAEGLEGLARESAERGEHERAAHWWGRLAAFDPLNSLVALRLMRSLAAAGDRARALQHARVHAALLREELDAAPDPEVEALAAELARAPEPAPRPTPAPAPKAPPVEPDVPPAAPTPTPAAPRAPGWKTRRAAVGAGALVLALLLIPGVWWLRGWMDDAATPARAPTTIAIFPFDVSGDEREWEEGMVYLLFAGLDGAGDLRVADPYLLLSRVTEEGGATPISPSDAASIARSLDADAYLRGTVVRSGESYRATASLYETRGDAAAVRVTAEGTHPAHVADELSRALLARRFGAPAERLSLAATRTTESIPALKEFLAGEQEFRAARYLQAAAAFARAVDEDPSFALAHYRLSTASEWSFRFTEAQRAANEALRLSERLSARDQTLIRAWQAFVTGDPGTAEQLYEGIVTEEPSDVEARSGLGEVRAHYNPVLGRPVRQAVGDFQRVLRDAPNYGEARFHMLEFAASDGNRAAFDSLLVGVDAGSEQHLSWKAARTLAWGTPAEGREMLQRLRGEEEVVVGIAAVRAGANFRDPPAAEAIARLLTTPDRPDPWRAAGRILVAQGELMRGAWGAARAQLDSAAVIEPAWALEIGALGALLPGAQTNEAELRRLRGELEAWDPSRSTPGLAFFFAIHADAHAQLRLYLLALLAVRLGDDAAVDRHTAELRVAGQTQEGREFGSSLLASVEAHRAARRGDLERALRLLDERPMHASLERIALSPFFARSLDRWLRAELHQRLGRHEEALRWYASLTDGPDILFWAPAHQRQADILTRLGRRDAAGRHHALFQAIRPSATAP